MEGKTRRKVAVGSYPVTLTNGVIIEARIAQSTLRYLRVMLDTHAHGQQLIEDLHLIAQGRPEDARPASRKVFARNVLVSSPEGNLLPEVRDVVLSAFRRSPDGIVLVEPYQPTDANRAALAAAESELGQMMRKHFGFGSDGSGGRPGR
jgi:hypothetical protein